MFEPVHGSAPDIAGRGLANPVGQIWAASMMLEHLGEKDAAKALLAAIEYVLSSPDCPKTPDLGGQASTLRMGQAISQAVDRSNVTG
jgi:tartrate dehydrogenase/decarboxylase/D-malate dehydrogenase